MALYLGRRGPALQVSPSPTKSAVPSTRTGPVCRDVGSKPRSDIPNLSRPGGRLQAAKLRSLATSKIHSPVLMNRSGQSWADFRRRFIRLRWVRVKTTGQSSETRIPKMSSCRERKARANRVRRRSRKQSIHHSPGVELQLQRSFLTIAWQCESSDSCSIENWLGYHPWLLLRARHLGRGSPQMI